MFLTHKIKRVALAGAMAAVLVLAGFLAAGAQQSPAAGLPPAAGLALPAAEASDIALPLPEDRGQAALEQTVKRLGTTASVLYIVAHPDDEDGALLTYLARGLGARVTLLTLTRGEGGQNAISAETYDALGLMRTNELLKADEYYGAGHCGVRRPTSASRRRSRNPLRAGPTSGCFTTRCWRCEKCGRR